MSGCQHKGERYRFTYCVNKQCDTNDGIVGWYIGKRVRETPVFRGHLLDWYNKPKGPVVTAQALTAAVLPWKLQDKMFA